MRTMRGGRKNKNQSKRARTEGEQSEAGSELSSDQTWALMPMDSGSPTEVGAGAGRGAREESTGLGAGRDSRTYQGITGAPWRKDGNEPSSSSGSNPRPFGKALSEHGAGPPWKKGAGSSSWGSCNMSDASEKFMERATRIQSPTGIMATCSGLLMAKSDASPCSSS